jgi:hypothetical protein
LAVVYVAGILIGWTGKLSGLLGIVLLVVVILGSIKVYLLFKKKLYNKFLEWFAKIPVKQLKVFAAIQILIGCLMLIFKRRIWF